MRDLRLTLKFKYQVVSMRNMKKKAQKKRRHYVDNPTQNTIFN